MAVSQALTGDFERDAQRIDATEAALPAIANTAASIGGRTLGAVAADRSLRIPKHVLIDSALAHAKAEQEKIQRDYQAAYDLPGIEKDIEDTHKWAEETRGRIDALTSRLSGEPVPEQETTLQPTIEEGLAGLAGLLMGVRGQDVAAGTATNARNRAGIAYQNRMKRYAVGRENTMTALEQGIRENEWAQRQLEAAKGRKAGVQSEMARGGMQLAMAGQEREFDTKLKQIGLAMDEERRRDDQAFESAMAGRKMAWELQLKSIEVMDRDRARQIENILKGLESLQEDPAAAEQNGSAIDGVAKTLEQLGFPLDAGTLQLFKARAAQNYQHAKREEARSDLATRAQAAQIGLGRDRLKLDAYKEGLEVNPDGSFAPLPLPGNLGGGQGGAGVFGSQRPNAAKGESDVQQLMTATVDMRTAEDEAATAKSAYDNLAGMLKTEAQKKGLALTPQAKALQEAEIKKRTASERMRVARANAITNGGPQYRNWLAVQHDLVLSLVQGISKGQVQQFNMPDGTVVDVATAGAKNAQQMLRRWFQETTGFDVDDGQLKQMKKSMGMTEPKDDTPMRPG